MDVQLPDGRLLRGVPEGTTKAQIAAKISGAGNNAGTGNAFAYGVSGGAVPFGNKITSGIGAGLAKMAGADGSIGELYNQAQEDTKATQEANPGATLAGNIAGIGTTLPLGFTKALTGEVATQGARGAVNAIPEGLSAINNFTRSGKAAKDASLLTKAGSLALRSGKGAAVAAPVGALYGAGDAEPGHMLEGAERGAGLAAGVGAALPVASAVLGYGSGGVQNIAKGIGARSSEALEDVSKAIRERSDKAYATMRQVGAVFTPDASNKIAQELEKTLASDGPLNARLHDKTLSVFSDIKDTLEKEDVSLENLDQWRQLLGQVAGDFNDKINARKAKLLINTLDDSVDNISEKDLLNGSTEAIDALKLGRQEYKTARKFEGIANILTKADGDPNKIKSGLNRFLDNKKNLRGYTDQEISALKNAAKYTAGEGIIKILGKFGFDLGTSQTMGNTALPVLSGLAAGGTIGAVTGGAIPVVGTAARQAQKYLARGKAETLLKVLEGGGTQKEIQNLSPKLKAISEQLNKSPTTITSGQLAELLQRK